MTVNDALIIEYSKVFGEPPKDWQYYFRGISRKSLLTLGAHFLGFENQSPTDESFVKLLSEVLGPENAEFQAELLNRVERYIPNDVVPVLINTESSLTLFEYALNHKQEVDTTSDAALRRNIVLGYLAINDAIRKKEGRVIPSINNLSGDLKLGALFFTQAYPYSNLVNYNESEVIYCQFVKAILFFEFMERSDDTRTLLKHFLQAQQSPSWKKYLGSFLALVNGILKHTQASHLTFTVTEDENFETSCTFLDSLITDESESKIEADYKILRDKPMYRLSRGKYRVIFSLFLVEKIYRSLYFKLASVNFGLPEAIKIKNLQSVLGDRFSEKTLLYIILNNIYEGSCITLTGTQAKAFGMEAEPDYYVRCGDQIFIFESKDFLIDATAKISYNFQLLEPELKKRYKAVLQLSKNVKRILSNEFQADNKISANPEIFPILVVHDHQYNVLGLNKIMGTWFKDELSKLPQALLKNRKVHGLVIINMDSLIYHQDILKDNTLKLQDVIKEYEVMCTFDNRRFYVSDEERSAAVKRTCIPFNQFLNDYIEKKGIRRQSSLLPEIGKRLFE